MADISNVICEILDCDVKICPWSLTHVTPLSHFEIHKSYNFEHTTKTHHKITYISMYKPLFLLTVSCSVSISTVVGWNWSRAKGNSLAHTQLHFTVYSAPLKMHHSAESEHLYLQMKDVHAVNRRQWFLTGCSHLSWATFLIHTPLCLLNVLCFLTVWYLN